MRSAVRVWALAAALLAPALPGAEGEGLVEVPRPPLETMEASVREQLDEARLALDELAAGGAAAERLAPAFGELGQLYLAYQQMLAAEACFENASRLDPGDYRWPYYLGYLRRVEGDLVGAEAAFARALELRPGDLVARLRLAQTRLERGGLEEAETLFLAVLAAAPGSAAARYGLGSIAAARGDAATAAGHFEAVLEAQPEASAVRYPLGLAYRDLGRTEEARRQLAQAGPRQVEVADGLLRLVASLYTGSGIHYVRGTRALRLGRLDEALEEYRLAVAAAPEDANARRALGLALLQAERFDEAAEQYAEAVRLEPQEALNHKDLGVALARSGRPAEAARSFALAVELDPDFKDARLGLGVTRVRLGQPDRALPHLERVVELDPDDPAGRRELGLVLTRLGRFADAARQFRWLVERDPGDAAARLNLASSLARLGDERGAADELEAVLALQPPPALAARALLLLGNLASRLDSGASPLERYRQAVELDPQLLPARFRLALELVAAARHDEAAAQFAAVAAAAPRHGPARQGEAAALLQAGRRREAAERLETAVETLPADAALARTLAILLATAPEADLRNGERSLRLARQLAAARPSALHTELEAMALAETGRFDEAAERQRRAVQELERAADLERAARARSRLDLYLRSEPCRAPWRTDPTLLALDWQPPDD